jgi:serine/threonine-protein kinase
MVEWYLARDTHLNRNLAVKMLTADFSAHNDRLRRFKQEGTAAAPFNHPNLGHITRFGERSNYLYRNGVHQWLHPASTDS